MRQFESGATRNTDDNKHDYEGFLSYPVIRRFGQYMHEHRIQADGQVRDSDNWQKGIPQDAYMKSAWRHFLDWWGLHRGEKVYDFEQAEVDIEDALCAIIFNAQGYLHEILKQKTESKDITPTLRRFMDSVPDTAYRVGPRPENESLAEVMERVGR